MTDNVYTHPYSTDYDPLMPIVEVGVSAARRSRTERALTALIDSGSDGTLIPIDILEAVGARYIDQARMQGILGGRRLVDIYLVSLRIGTHRLRGVRVIAVDAKGETILGRNVLNRLVITLNGLASTTEIPT